MGFLHSLWLALQENSPVPSHQSGKIGALPMQLTAKPSASHGQRPHSPRFIFPPGITENFPNTYFISPRRAWPDGNLLREVVHVPHHGRQRPPRYKGKWRGRRTSPEPPRTHGPGSPACPPQAFNAECMVSLKKKKKNPHKHLTTF